MYGYEQMWFRMMCRHNAPKPPPDKRDYYQERRDNRRLTLQTILAKSERGVPTKEIAAGQGWSVAYTQSRLRFARQWYGMANNHRSRPVWRLPSVE